MADDVGDDFVDDDAPEQPTPPESVGARWTNAVGYACIGLILMGVLLFTSAVPRIVDPEQWVCSASRATIEAANDDDDAWNDVDLGDVESADDLSCADAVALAGEIPTSEDSDETLAVATPSATRWYSVAAAAIVSSRSPVVSARP